MRIIKRGTPPQDREYRATCRNCGTIFEFRAIEAKHVDDQRDGGFLSIDCPECKSRVTVTP